MTSREIAGEIGRSISTVQYRGWSQPIDATLYLRGKRWSVAMDRGFRRGFTTAEKTELWDRWQSGESIAQRPRSLRSWRSGEKHRCLPEGLTTKLFSSSRKMTLQK